MTDATAGDQKDHINPLVPTIHVSDGVEVPKEPKWVPPWAVQCGNGKIPLERMTQVDAKLGDQGYLVPEVAVRWQSLQAAAKAAGFNLTMTGANRTYTEQLELFRERYTLNNTGKEPRKFEGKTYWLLPNKAMVASPGTSNHGWGCAIDMALSVEGQKKPQSVTAAFVKWAAGVALSHGFSWEDSEPWHIHAIDMGATAPTAAPAHSTSTSGTSTSGTSTSGTSPSAPAGMPTPPLQLGSSGPQVALLQQLCAAHGWGDPGHPDGKFGPRTQTAVKAMQAAIGAKADGVYGPHTAARLAGHIS